MLSYKYYQWDGTQVVDLDADDIMAELAEDLMDHGDLRRALERLLRRGMRGQNLLGLQDLLQRLKARRQQRLNQYNLGSVVDEIKKRLEEILKTEQEGIGRWVEEARQRAQEAMSGAPGSQPSGQSASADQSADQSEEEGSRPKPGAGEISPEAAQSLLNFLEKMAKEKEEFLGRLPKETGAALKELSQYEFMDPDAKRMYDELMEMLRQQVAESFFQQLQQGLSGMTPEQMAGLRQMIQALNQMVRERMAGGEPDFQKFMEQFGGYFGPNPPQSLEELLEQMAQQMEQMEDLLASLSPEQRKGLQEMMESLLQDMGFQEDLSELAAYMDELFPRERPQDYPFRGDDPLTLREAMRLMEEMGKLEELENELRSAQRSEDLDKIDPEKLRDLLGNEEAQSLEMLKELAKKLEEAGYIKKTEDKLELTPRGMRKIGQKALRDIFSQLKKDRFGNHEAERRGVRGERSDETKIYQFGDPFLIDLEKTLMNSLEREGPGVPVKVEPQDFEVYKTEHLSQCSTVLMLDQSRSMGYSGRFLAAKKMAIALQNLIRTHFPKDNLYILGFSDYAQALKEDDLPHTTWSYYVSGTNMHHAFMLARQLLARHGGGTKQIIMVSDGEPTAHLEGGQAYFAWPPTYRTIQATLREVKRCTREGIIINTFMLDRSYYLAEFVTAMAKMNKGRVFFTSPDKLGEYVLVDYLSNKRKKIS